MFTNVRKKAYNAYKGYMHHSSLRGLQIYSPRSKLAVFTWEASLMMNNYIE